MAIEHVFEVPPPGARSDWTVPQHWDCFTAADHAVWDGLISRQAERIAPYASRRFNQGLAMLALGAGGIPDYRDLNRRLCATTGWTVVAVTGAIPNAAFFAHLANRRFPVANFLRGPEALDYSEEPDMFHDLFGHLPMLTDPSFADFLQAYGEAGLRAGPLGGEGLLGRLYLHTVEFGLVEEDGKLRGFGAGLLSSLTETVHALTGSDVRRLHFNLPRIMRTDYLFDSFQKEYFVIPSFEHLLAAMEEADLAALYRELERQPLLAPGASSAEDRPYP